MRMRTGNAVRMSLAKRVLIGLSLSAIFFMPMVVPKAWAAEVDRIVAAWTRTRSAHEVFDACQAAGVPAGVVATGRDLMEDPHLRERGFLLEMEHAAMGPVTLPGLAFRFGHDPLPTWRLGPLMGQDNDYVLGEILGRSAAKIARLTAEGIVK